MTNRHTILLAFFIIMATFLINTQGVSQAQNADNTKINQRDKIHDELTADQQGQSESDLQITQDIRKAVISEPSLSMYAHNVKIITRDGTVTLKGPVTSVEERRLIENLASKIVGLEKIESEMDIVAK